MISLIRAAWQEEMRVPMFVGLSTDGYPDSDDPAMKNGARCYHMDTGKEYEYSQDDNDWYEVPSGGGGGGSEVVAGYYYNDNFYYDSEYTRLISPVEGTLYHDNLYNDLYIYNDSYYIKIAIDTNVTQNSENLITSGAVYEAIASAIGNAIGGSY